MLGIYSNQRLPNGVHAKLWWQARCHVCVCCGKQFQRFSELSSFGHFFKMPSSCIFCAFEHAVKSVKMNMNFDESVILCWYNIINYYTRHWEKNSWEWLSFMWAVLYIYCSTVYLWTIFLKKTLFETIC